MKIRIHWFSIPVCAAAGFGLYYLGKMLTHSSDRASESVPAAKNDGKASGKAKGKAAVKASLAVNPDDLKEGSYSFISGFQNAATVEVRFLYDSSRFSCTVMEDGFLAESGDSHVAVLSGEDCSAQLEYGNYYSGEDFSQLKADLQAKHPDLKELVYGTLSGVLYQNGDNLCLDFPVPDDLSSYLHVTLLKEKGNDDPLSALPDYPYVASVLSSLSFTRS